MDSNDKVISALGYVGLLFLVPLLAGKSEFARFHANQGLVLFLTDIIGGIAIGIVSAILGFIPVIGWILAAVLPGALSLALFVLMIIGIINAAQGEMKPLPLIGQINILK